MKTPAQNRAEALINMKSSFRKVALKCQISQVSHHYVTELSGKYLNCDRSVPQAIVLTGSLRMGPAVPCVTSSAVLGDRMGLNFHLHLRSPPTFLPFKHMKQLELYLMGNLVNNQVVYPTWALVFSNFK